MSQPIITLATEAPGSTFDASALTSRSGTGWSELDGFSGSAWLVWVGGTPRRKKEGAEQLLPTLSSGASVGSNSTGISVAYTSADEIGGSTDSPLTSSNVLNASVNDYIRYPAIIADPQTRTFHWQGANNNGGTFLITATLSDGSAGPQTMTLGTNNCGFSCVFTARTTCTLQIEIKCTASPSGANSSFLFSQFTWIGVPVAAPIPRGANKYFQRLGLYGGANA